MNRSHKPSLFALLAFVAFFGGYAHQLAGQFEHHHLGGQAPASHEAGHHHHHHSGDEHHDHDRDRAPCDHDRDGNGDPSRGDTSCEEFCALMPALVDTRAPALVPALSCVELLALSADTVPGAIARSIDHPPAA